MNKKATIIHWIVFLVLAALGIFYIFSNDIEPSQHVKGEIVQVFLHNNYFPAQKEMLEMDRLALRTGSELAAELAQNGGFSSSESSPCGKYKGLNIWKRNCFPNVNEAAQKIAREKLNEKLPEDAFTESGFAGTNFYGKSAVKEIKWANNTYRFKKDFIVDLHYSLEEYSQLIQEAGAMLNTCMNKKDLQNCLIAVKPSFWKYTSCSQEEFPSDAAGTRIIPFCIESPHQYVLNLGTESATVAWPVQYLLAIDFTPSEPLASEEVSGSYNIQANAFELHLQRDRLAEKYLVHYSDYFPLQGKSGSVSETFDLIPQVGYFNEKREFRDEELILDAAACTSSGIKEANKGYLCGEEVVLMVGDEGNIKLTDNQVYIFGVTTFNHNQESKIGLILGLKKAIS